LKKRENNSVDPGKQVVIIGNGIAGITAARHIRKRSTRKITVISSESEFFFSRTALMYVYMGHLRWKDLKPYEDHFWSENGIELKQAQVTAVVPEENKIVFDTGEQLQYDILILATGSVPRKPGCKGEDLQGVQGLVSKQDLELLERNSLKCRSAVIVGGGLIGVELAEMLATRKIEVTMLIREKGFWGNVLPPQDALFISRHLESHGIKLLPETQIREIRGDTRVRSVVTDEGDEIACDLVGLCIGVRPNIKFLKDSGIETEEGILVDGNLRTNFSNIFAIGDCAQHRSPKGDRAPIEAVWYSARMMGETVAQTICGNTFPYSPGHWFNSAKFFDIEYQTYGRVGAAAREQEAQLHWEHSDGTKAMTFAFDPESQKFLGINSFGIRLRHEVFDGWLTEERSLDYVLKHLGEANFDPEFYARHEREILKNIHQVKVENN